METSFELAQRGAKVYMLCRDLGRGLTALETLKQRPSANSNLSSLLFVKQVDISLQKEIKNFVTEFEEEKVDILVNNAGCMIDGRPVTDEGIEVNFATNVMGPYLLTESLLPKLQKQEKGKKSVVLTVTSGGMLTQKLEAKDLQLSKVSKGIEIYAQNKVIKMMIIRSNIIIVLIYHTIIILLL